MTKQLRAWKKHVGSSEAGEKTYSALLPKAAERSADLLDMLPDQCNLRLCKRKVCFMEEPPSRMLSQLSTARNHP